MLESLNTSVFEYERLKPEEMQRRGILGRLVGVMADTVNPTRNGRSYSSKLWENVFNNPIMKERIENNCCFGELGHPIDREETDMEKIAICMDGLPKKDKDGKLQAVFNILDTPNGRILKTLCDYGCNIGISSRGSGDLVTDFDGNESVDPDTYNCEGWDAVLIPAVKEARLKYVTESLDKKRYNKSLRTKLQEALDKETADNRKVMSESLSALGILLEANEDEPEAGPKPDKKFINQMNKLGKEEEPEVEEQEETVEFEEEPEKELENFTYKDIEVIKDPESGKFVCEIDGDSYSFNNEKNARIWIDMNTKNKKSSLKEEQIGRTETKDDKNVDDVLTPGSSNNKEISDAQQLNQPFNQNNQESEEELTDEAKSKKVTVTVNESVDWTDLNGTEQFAVERIINAIDSHEFRPDPEEFDYAVRTVVNMYGDANEFLDPDDPMYHEEGSYGRVKDYLLNGSYYKDKIKKYFGLNDLQESLTEDVDDITMARIQLRQYLDDWYKEHIAPELSSDDEASGWDSDLQYKYLDFRNYLDPDLIQDKNEDDFVVDNIETEIDTLQEMLKYNKSLEKQIISLQEKLSVSNAMEKDLKEELNKCKDKISILSKASKENKVLTEQLNAVKDSAAKLNESKQENIKRIKALTDKYNKLTEEKQAQDNEFVQLKENYEILDRDLIQTKEQFSKKFERQNQLLEKYQKITKNAIDRYINMQAVNLGVKPVEIKNRLSESFTFNDIDSVCEDLREYKLNVSKLPFNTGRSLNEGIGIKANNFNNELLPVNEVDELTDYDMKLMEAYL
ncbi:MAG: hypothetical protein IJH55_03670 [Romboutsia sp.]|nr:hypothetical protein [Romboutsia sp.]